MGEKADYMKNLLRPNSSVAEYLLSDMDGLRIRFPQQALIEKISKTRNCEEDLEDENLELSSFNLSLGELGTARLVTSIGQEENIRVVLEFEKNSYQGHPLKMVVSMLVLDGEGQLLQKVQLFFFTWNDKLFTGSRPDESSCYSWTEWGNSVSSQHL